MRMWYSHRKNERILLRSPGYRVNIKTSIILWQLLCLKNGRIKILILVTLNIQGNLKSIHSKITTIISCLRDGSGNWGDGKETSGKDVWAAFYRLGVLNYTNEFAIEKF